MQLKETHDIGMALQYKVEALPEVERAFVHLDYEKRLYDEHVESKTLSKRTLRTAANSPGKNQIP